VRRILIVRLGSLGDLVHTLPAAAALRRTHPSVEIDWLVDAVHADLLALVPVITSVVTLQGRTVPAWLGVTRTLRARSYDAAIDFQGLVKSAALARFSGAARVIGFGRRTARESAAAWFYSEAIEIGEGRHVIDKNLRLAGALGVVDGPIEFPIADVESGAAMEVEQNVPGPYAILNPGAAWPNKRWPAESFGRLAAILRDRHGLRSVVLWGPGEAPIARDVVSASSGAAFLAPATTLSDIVAVARRARLVVSGDTGPTHIAAAVGTPVVALFGPTTPRRNGPWHPSDITIERYDACECHYERICRRTDGWCLGTVTVDEVASAIGRRLR
jgi:lipopolysaccharide heptosyltransferase I